MNARCYVCHLPVEPDAKGRVRVEGVCPEGDRMTWTWGPVVVHEQCRLRVRTPFDDRIGDGFMSLWERLPVQDAIDLQGLS